MHTTGVEVAESTICEFLHCVGFTTQKMKLVAKQVDESLKTQFIIDVSLLEPDMFIFVDEIGADVEINYASMATAYVANLSDHKSLFSGVNVCQHLALCQQVVYLIAKL